MLAELEKPEARREIVFFSSRRRHTRLQGDWSSDVCSSDLSELRECLGLGHLVVLLAGGGVVLIRLLDGFRRGLARREVLHVDDDLAARQVVQAHRARVGRPLVHVVPTDVLLPTRLPGLDHEAVIRTGDAAVVLPPPLPERPFDALYPAFRQVPSARAGRALCGRRDEPRDAAVLVVDAGTDGLGLLRG